MKLTSNSDLHIYFKRKGGRYMKKKWATWLSLLVLCLSIVANISQGYTVLADSSNSLTSGDPTTADPFNYIKKW